MATEIGAGGRLSVEKIAVRAFVIVLDTRFNTPFEVISAPSPGSEFHRFVSLAINCVRRQRDGVYMLSSLFHLR